VFQAREDALTTFVSNSGTPNAIFNLSPNSVTLAAGQAGIFRVEVEDVSGNAVPGVSVSFTANGAGVTATAQKTTDANGIASVTVTFPTTGTATVVATIATGTSTTTNFSVTVGTTQVRAFDGLESFTIPSDNVPSVANINFQCDKICVPTATGGGFVGASKSALPTALELDFPGNATSNAKWTVDIFVRTRSLLPTSTAKMLVEVTDGAGTTVVADSSLISVASGLSEVSIELTQASAGPFSVNPTLTVGQQIVGHLRITSSSSSDSATPGLEIITDPSAQSTMHVPGPVYFATSSTSGLKFLVSSPDPRQ
jgi:hypothetical protein